MPPVCRSQNEAHEIHRGRGLEPGLKQDSDDIQELLDFHNRELTMDEFIEMLEQQQDTEEVCLFSPSSNRRSNDCWEFDNKPKFY
ncbi:hypothetical protein TNCV_2341901 [Trichonephila clavipes]|uniref:Uncharacterized protein n=1 Tax=Trichonephila clavipes TaxID=2585209 RepID=A0A8X6R6C0_TRICX|nr:hypothetical protein TNCV_2341901 [Trichonephila clavipes]